MYDENKEIGGRCGWEGKRNKINGRKKGRGKGNVHQSTEKTREGNWKVAFWNVAGLVNKNKEL